ncbi:unnamed protein product [Leptidea sinapis]|uniref:ADP-ribose pyrophosphatase, mitochondrial n=1 Tax=Leptidea sinapis TaxID=189913 RepID=A0A5E4Q162_9NEOP|nr:unnamed protein product [Leptidea sinapis]
MGHYNIVNGYPLNPIGRTGLQGRGVLGRWGPNHAADPIVTPDKENWKEKFKDFFSKGIEIYRGYVDDPRNTDNAWMETIAYNFHDEIGAVVGNIKLQAGDDAIGVQWVDITPDINLYASHKDIIDSVLNKHQKC